MYPSVPVALFAWRRPQHLMTALSALEKNAAAPDTRLHIFVDGPKSESDIPIINEVLQIARRPLPFKSVRVTAADTNQGLSRSIISGIGEVLEDEERVIVLEDDIEVSPFFLDFMNGHLEAYARDEQVASIHGATYLLKPVLPSTFFIRGADCWGWGTWRRAWGTFEPDGARLLGQLRERGLLDVFSFEGTAPFEEMLIDQIQGRNDSWAIRWYASALLNDMLTLYPGHPLAINIGEDGSGTHGGSSNAYRQQLSQHPVAIERIPLVESAEGRQAFREFFKARYQLPSSRLGRWAWRRARRLKNSFSH